MLVARKLQLRTKVKGLYVYDKTAQYDVLRHESVISKQSVKESEANYKHTGVIWVVDEEKTKQRNEIILPKTKKGIKPNDTE